MPMSGKSTIGNVLASKLGIEHIDTDRLVEQECSNTIANMFIEYGEDYFRFYERNIIYKLLCKNQNKGVISFGGGAIESDIIRELLIWYSVIYLYVDYDILLIRNGISRPRPILLGNVRQRLKYMMHKREFLYKRCANLIIDNNDNIEKTINRLLKSL